MLCYKERVPNDNYYVYKIQFLFIAKKEKQQVNSMSILFQTKIIYIDYGNVGTCEITKLINLELFDPLMTKIAPQVYELLK